MAKKQTKTKTKIVKKKMTRTVIKKSTLVFLKTTFLIFLCFISFYLILFGIESGIAKKKELISIDKVNDLKYLVNLKKNDYYDESIVAMNKKYFADLVDKIDLEFKHSSIANNKHNFNYKTKELVTLYIYDKGDEAKEILRKNFLSKESYPTFGLNEEIYHLSYKTSIDYEYYDNFVKDFQEKYALAVEAKLHVELQVESSATIENYGRPVNDLEKVELRIPLNQRTFEIEMNYEANSNEKIHQIIDTRDKKDIIFFSIGIAGLVASIILIIYEIIIYIKEEKDESIYLSTLNRILSNYGDIIVMTKCKLNLQGLNIIDVESFDELLDAQNELRIPIAYYEIRENEESAFVIITGNQAWKYRLILKHLEEETEN